MPEILIAEKLPIEVRAWQATNNIDDSPEWLHGKTIFSTKEDRITVFTLEGNMDCKAGDYIIEGIKGEVYPCRKDIFESTYRILRKAQCR